MEDFWQVPQRCLIRAHSVAQGNHISTMLFWLVDASHMVAHRSFSLAHVLLVLLIFESHHRVGERLMLGLGDTLELQNIKLERKKADCSHKV